MTDFLDLNLKAADEAAMAKALISAGFIKDSESGTLYHPAASLQLLPPGMVTRATGEVIDGIPVREPVHGYHVNVRTQDPTLATALKQVVVAAETPQYVWA